MRYEPKRLATIVGACLIALGVGAAGTAQQTTPQESTPQQSTKTETTGFEVISVQGNDLVVKLDDGTTKAYTVPEDFRFDVGGQQLSVHDLQPGMKGTATVTTITTVKPVSVTEVRNGTVLQTTPNSVIVRGPNGSVQRFTQGDVDKRNVTIVRDGKPIQLSDLRAGDTLSATIVTEKPPQVMTQRQVQAAITKSAPPPSEAAPTASGGAAATTGSSTTAPRATGGTTAPEATGGATEKKELPKTASERPLVGLIGVVSLAIGIGLALRRRRQAV